MRSWRDTRGEQTVGKLLLPDADLRIRQLGEHSCAAQDTLIELLIQFATMTVVQRPQ